MGGSPDITAEDAALMANEFAVIEAAPEEPSITLGDTDPVDLDGAARIVRGFSLAGASGSLIGASGGDITLELQMTAHPHIKGL